MWILEKYNDITLKRGIANLGRSHRLPCVLTISMNFHKPMSVQYIFSIAGVFAVAQMELPCGWKKSWTSRRTLVTTQTTNPSQRSCFTNSPNIHYIKWLSQELNKYIYIYTYSYSNHLKKEELFVTLLVGSWTFSVLTWGITALNSYGHGITTPACSWLYNVIHHSNGVFFVPAISVKKTITEV